MGHILPQKIPLFDNAIHVAYGIIPLLYGPRQIVDCSVQFPANRQPSGFRKNAFEIENFGAKMTCAVCRERSAQPVVATSNNNSPRG